MKIYFLMSVLFICTRSDYNDNSMDDDIFRLFEPTSFMPVPNDNDFLKVEQVNPTNFKTTFTSKIGSFSD